MANTPEQQIGHSIRALRKKAKHSIGELAELAGLDESYVNHLELGKVNPTLSTLTKVARGLNLAVRDLLAPIASERVDQDYQINQAVRVLLARHSAEQKRAILAVLKALRNPKRLEAFKQLLGR